MKKEHLFYLKLSIGGVLFVSILIAILKFIVFLNSTFHALKENSPVFAYCVGGALILIFLIVIVACLVFILKQRKKEVLPNQKPKKEYSIKPQEELLADVEEALSDPQKSTKVKNKTSQTPFKDNHIKLVVYGHKNVGKTSLMSSLRGINTEQGTNSLNITVEEFALSPEIEQNDLPFDILADSESLFLFISDRDIRDYEFTKFMNIIKNTSNFMFVFSKVDLLSVIDKDEIEKSIKDKFNQTIHTRNFIAVSAAPLPRNIIKIDSEGNETEEVRKLAPDINQLQDWLISFAKKHGYTDIQFS